MIECFVVFGFECEIIVLYGVINLWVVKCGIDGCDGKLFVFVGYIDVVLIGLFE